MDHSTPSPERFSNGSLPPGLIACSRSNSPGPDLSSAESPGFLPVYDWRDYRSQMPFLPTTRPRALTPAGFQDDDTQNRPFAMFQQSSWYRLPPNLRRDILRLAFGDQRVHMCLNLDFKDPINVPINESSIWTWRGCICKRKYSKNEGAMTRGGCNRGPWADFCFDHQQDTYRQASLDEPENIGVMGWLRSCRQNYAETLDVLYSTNTIVLSGEATILHLRDLLEPSHLQLITSLEVKCVPEEEGFNLLQHLLDMLEPHHDYFPRLTRLYVSVEDKAHPTLPTLTQSIKSFDKLVRGRPNLEECAFALPWLLSITGDILCDGLGADRKSYSQVWRTVDDNEVDSPGDAPEENSIPVDYAVPGKLDVIQLPFVDSYPKPPFHLGHDARKGYWLLEASAASLVPSPDWNIFSPGYTGDPLDYSPGSMSGPVSPSFSPNSPSYE